MERDAYEASLAQDGYAPSVEVTLAPHERRDPHTHDFAVRGLVLRGMLGLMCGEDDRRYPAGSTFELDRGVPHYEHAGAEGTVYLAGRRGG